MAGCVLLHNAAHSLTGDSDMTITKCSPLAGLPFRNVNTRALRTGDLFVTQDGHGVLVLSSLNYGHGSFRPLESLTAVDMQLRTVQVPRPMHTTQVVLDDDTLPTCDTCEDGCNCSRPTGDAWCEHAYCWAADHDATCPGAVRQQITTARNIAARLARR
jgi:hypothetical protein